MATVQDVLPEKFVRTIKGVIKHITSKNIGNLKSIILYGSCSRLEAKPNSDIDFMLITESDKVSRELITSIRSEIDDIFEEVDVNIKFYTKEMLSVESCFNSNVKKDGVVVWTEGKLTECGKLFYA